MRNVTSGGGSRSAIVATPGVEKRRRKTRPTYDERFMSSDPFSITLHPLHLGLGALTTVEPEFTGEPEWYQAYEARHAKDGAEGRLVTVHSFSEPWDVWEMHPVGSELVLCLDGRITLHQEHATGESSVVTLDAGHYAVNEPGTWHTADVEGSATALFITAGQGTQHRPRA
jgi:hypothetical protein